MVTLNEHAIEKDRRTSVDLSRLEGVPMSDETFTEADRSLVRACHDVYIELKNPEGKRGLLLIERVQEPAQGILWPIGGRVLRGIQTEESLRRKAKEECNLGLKDIRYLGVSRVFWQESSLEHERGCDAFGFNFYAKGVGNLGLNKLHEKPRVVTPREYKDQFRAELHPYVVEFMDKAMELVRKRRGLLGALYNVYSTTRKFISQKT